MSRRQLWAFLAFLAGVGCQAREGGESSRRDLAPGTLALVGEAPVTAGQVNAVRPRFQTPREATEAVVHDVLVAQAADEPTRSVIRRAMLVKALDDRLTDQARAMGPIQEQERQQAMTEHWLDWDRPRSVRTAHVVVLAGSPEQADLARQVANDIHRAVEGATSAEDFAKRLKGVDLRGLEIKVERLPPVVADGRLAPADAADGPPGGRLVVEFAQAAVALRAGEISSPVQTEFGYHVIFAVEVRPAEKLDAGHLEQAVDRVVVARRAARLRQELTDALRQQTSVEVVRAADNVTRKAWPDG